MLQLPLIRRLVCTWQEKNILMIVFVVGQELDGKLDYELVSISKLLPFTVLLMGSFLSNFPVKDIKMIN